MLGGGPALMTRQASSRFGYFRGSPELASVSLIFAITEAIFGVLRSPYAENSSSRDCLCNLRRSRSDRRSNVAKPSPKLLVDFPTCDDRFSV